MDRMGRTLLGAAALLACAAGGGAYCGGAGESRGGGRAGEKVFGLIMSRVREENAAGTDINFVDRTVRDCLERLREDGSFADIDYGNPEGRTSAWDSQRHVERLRLFALAYTRKGGAFYGDEALRGRAVAALEFWLREDRTCTNWWFLEIAEPQAMGLALIHFRAGKTPLPAPLEGAALERMRVNGGDPAAQTGANKTDIALHYFYRACLTSDAALLAASVGQVYGTLRYAPAFSEGLQADGSNFQHGPQLYIGGYGDDFIKGVTLFARYTAGTDYALRGEGLAVLSRFVRETYLPAIRGRYMLWNVSGRGILSRPGEQRKSGAALYMTRMMDIDPGHAGEYRAAAARLRGENSDEPLVRNRHYYIADYTLHNRPAYTIGVRLASARTSRIENGNGENLRSYYASDGSAVIAVTGEEYDGVFPLWDWTRVPGVTCPQVPAREIPVAGPWQQPGDAAYAGGVSNGVYGATGYAFGPSYSGVSARKGWFFFDKEVIFLGSGITSSLPFDVDTSLNQCLFAGRALSSGGEIPLGAGAEGLSWVWHGDVGYAVLPLRGAAAGGALLSADARPRTGAWADINLRGNPEPVTRDIFTVWFPHGLRPGAGGEGPEAGASYACAVVPGLGEAAFAAWREEAPVEVLSNTPSLQAVRHKGLGVQAFLFYREGAFQEAGGEEAGEGGLAIKVDRDCALLLTAAPEEAGGAPGEGGGAPGEGRGMPAEGRGTPAEGRRYALYASDPAQKRLPLTVSLRLPGSSRWETIHCAFDALPVEEAGSTVRAW